MAESQKKSSTVNSMEKNSFLDLDIDKDFLSSWKTASVAEREMDFDLMPVSKGKKKSFDFDIMDMEFNLDGDFGKISSFKMDMPGLDISSTPQKDGKPKENSKKSSSRNDKGKADQFTFGFDFDDFENFGFEPSPTKGGSKAQTDKDNIEFSPSGSGCQDIEVSSHVKLTGDMTLKEDLPEKPSLPGTLTTFDMNYQGGGSADLEPTMKISPSKLAMNDSATSKYSTVTDEFSSDKKMTHPEEPIITRELPAICQSEQSLFLEPVDREACTENVVVQELSSDSLGNDEPTEVNSLEALDKVDCVDKTSAGSIGEQDVNVSTIAGSTCDYKDTMSGNSQFFLTVAISEKNNSDNNQRGIENHRMEDETTDLGQLTSFDENSFITSFVSGKISDISTEKENQEPASKILELTSVSEPAAELLVEKEKENGREPSVSCPSSFIQSEKPQCHVPKSSSTQTKLSSLSSKNKDFTQPSLVEKRRDWDSVQSDIKLAPFSSEHSKTLLRRELPQTRSQESFKGPELCGEVRNPDGVQNAKKLNDSSTTKNLDMVKEKSPLKQRETSMKDLNTLSLSVEIKKRTAQSSKSSITLAGPLTSKKSPVGEKLSAVGGRKTADLCGLKLSSLSLDSMKFPSQKDMKSVGNIGQTRAVKTPLDVAHFSDSKKKTPSAISTKRKTLEGFNADIAVLNPSKRVSLSPIQNRKFVETSMTFSDKKASNHNNVEDDCNRSTLYSRQLSTSDIPRKTNIEGLEMSFSIENDSHIKQAEAYSKKLDDIHNMLRKKHEEAKELLVRASVNSNKLLMLKLPLLQLEEKISFEFLLYKF
ncbi:hypothetical protein ACJIZ3_005496 [Penstemon smallii]|uniref:Uncharacterized protein n=1 Tax=Penstemon smallii TaxID=265156 RepID=A0ABD3S521_9LAMI